MSGSTTTLHLVRHASHDRLGRVLCGRMAGVTLSEAGRAEAEALAERLVGDGLAAVWTSPLDRARETAAPLAARLGLGPQLDEGLNELEIGDWSGQTFDALHHDPRWAVWNNARHVARPPAGETMLEAQARALGAVERARAAHPDAAVALVSHADVVKAVACWAFGLTLDAMPRFDIDPASVTTVVVGDWGTKVTRLNETAPTPGRIRA